MVADDDGEGAAPGPEKPGAEEQRNDGNDGQQTGKAPRSRPLDAARLIWLLLLVAAALLWVGS